MWWEQNAGEEIDTARRRRGASRNEEKTNRAANCVEKGEWEGVPLDKKKCYLDAQLSKKLMGSYFKSKF